MNGHRDPHEGQPVLRAGAPVADARLVTILLHGRGGSAADMLGLSRQFGAPNVAYLAPQASGHTWYPYSFLAPLDENEPALSSAMRMIAGLIVDLGDQGVPPDRVALIGFSQGACLTLEFAARHARRFAAVAALTGGLIGPPGTPHHYTGSFSGTPIFIGSSDIDAHVPLMRVRESTAVLRQLGAIVDERIYAGMGHTVNRDEVEAVNALLSPTMTKEA